MPSDRSSVASPHIGLSHALRFFISQNGNGLVRARQSERRHFGRSPSVVNRQPSLRHRCNRYPQAANGCKMQHNSGFSSQPGGGCVASSPARRRRVGDCLLNADRPATLCGCDDGSRCAVTPSRVRVSLLRLVVWNPSVSCEMSRPVRFGTFRTLTRPSQKLLARTTSWR